MRCSSCGSENGQGAKFCSECSAPLQHLCPACGASYRANAKFCIECGSPVPSVPPAEARSRRPHLPVQQVASVASLDAQVDQAERRHLSILFCDLVGSTEIAAKLDPEDLRNLLTSYQDAAEEAVEQFGGHVALNSRRWLISLFRLSAGPR